MRAHLVRAVQYGASSSLVRSQNLGRSLPQQTRIGHANAGPGAGEYKSTAVNGGRPVAPEPVEPHETDDHHTYPAWVAAAHLPACMRVLQIIYLLGALGSGPLERLAGHAGGVKQEEATQSRDR